MIATPPRRSLCSRRVGDPDEITPPRRSLRSRRVGDPDEITPPRRSLRSRRVGDPDEIVSSNNAGRLADAVSIGSRMALGGLG